MAMFYFIKRLPVFRIVTEPYADSFPLLGGLTVALYEALDIGGFIIAKDLNIPALFQRTM